MVYLMLAIPATLAFRAESAWLNSWYPFLAGPVALFRLAAGLEIAHRQTDGFRYWSRLTGSVFLLAGMFAGLAWVQSSNPTPLRSFVELRRLLHLFGGAVFLILESFWLSQGGGWYRRVDRAAAVWGVLAVSHGVAGFLSGLGRYGVVDAWLTARGVYWGVDLACYLGLTAVFLGGRRFGILQRSSLALLRGGLHFPFVNL
jgi:hypothetical protein